MKNRDDKSAFYCCAVTTLALLAGTASAGDIEANFRGGYATSDNITRVETNTIDDQIQSIGLSLNYIEETRKLDVLFRSTFDHLHYEEGTFEDDVVGGLTADVTYWFVEERFNWILLDNYGQQLINPLAVSTPNNRQNVNFLTTGPSLILPMGDRNSFITELRYSDINYEDLGQDNTRQSGRVAVSRSLNDYASASLNVRYRKIEFDDSGVVDPYEITDAFVRYESESPRNSVLLDIGYTEADIGVEKSDGYLLAFTWERTLSPTWTANLIGGSGYSDRADLFRELQNADSPSDQPINVNGANQPFRFDYAGVTYGLSAPRTSFSFGFGWNSQDFEVGPALDRDSINARLALDRRLSRDFSILASLDFVSRDYQTIDRKDDDIRAVAGLRYAIGVSWFLSLQAQYNDRESTVVGASFSENRYVLQFGYVPGWGRPVSQ